MFIRVQSFRKLLLRVGEIRSQLPPAVHIMALIATAATVIRKDV